MKHFYHVRYDPNLYKGFCATGRIPCDCTGGFEQISNPWLPNLDKTLQPRYAIGKKTCKCSSILRGYNKWYIARKHLKKQQTQIIWILKTSLS